MTTPAGERTIRSWTLSYGEAPLTGVSLLDSVQLRSHGSSRPDVVRRPQRFRYALPEPDTWHARFMESEPLGAPPPLTDPDARLAALDGHALPGVAAGPRRSLHVLAECRRRALGRACAPARHADRGEPRGDRVAAARPRRRHPGGSARRNCRRRRAAGLLRQRRRRRAGTASSRIRAGVRGRRRSRAGARASPTSTETDGSTPCTAAPASTRAGATKGAKDGRSRAPRGWATARPHRTRSSGDPLVRTADMTGDGLPDLVRLRSGRVEYWPNLGHGRFGARVRMTAGPRFERGYGSGADRARRRRWRRLRRPGHRRGRGRACALQPLRQRLRRSPSRTRSCRRRSRAPYRPPTCSATAVRASPGPRRAGGAPVRSLYAFGEAHPYALIGAENGAGLESEIDVPVVRRGRAARPAGGGALDHVPAVPGPRGGRDARARHPLRSRQRDRATATTRATSTRSSAASKGFRRVDQLEIGDDARPDALTVHHYRIGEERAPGAGREASALNRMLHRVEVFAPDGSPICR